MYNYVTLVTVTLHFMLHLKVNENGRVTLVTVILKYVREKIKYCANTITQNVYNSIILLRFIRNKRNSPMNTGVTSVTHTVTQV
jgi:hypothetical protein